jgi:hypothetical protein
MRGHRARAQVSGVTQSLNCLLASSLNTIGCYICGNSKMGGKMRGRHTHSLSLTCMHSHTLLFFICSHTHAHAHTCTYGHTLILIYMHTQGYKHSSCFPVVPFFGGSGSSSGGTCTTRLRLVRVHVCVFVCVRVRLCFVLHIQMCLWLHRAMLLKCILYSLTVP